MIKKMIAIVALIIVVAAMTALIIPAFGFAECDKVYVQTNSVTNTTFTDPSMWAISNNQMVIGKKSPVESVPILMPQCPTKTYVRGCVETGLIREKASMIASVNGVTCGFTKLTAVVTIKSEYLEVVKTIVFNKLNEEELTANKIIACTMWWEGEAVSHIFFTSNSQVVAVGTVAFNGGRDVVILYMGDFDGDGSFELGFTAGWNTEIPLQNSVPSSNSCKAKKGCCGKGCFIQINILSIVNNCFKKLCD